MFLKILKIIEFFKKIILTILYLLIFILERKYYVILLLKKNGKVFYYENKKDKLSFKEKFHGYTIEGFKKWLNRGKILNKELINKVLENVNDFYGNLEKNK